jgi:hypothetical protein
MSPATSPLNVGAAAAPEVGPAQTRLALCVLRVSVRLPAVVTGDPETPNTDVGATRPTLVSVPVSLDVPAPMLARAAACWDVVRLWLL